MVDPGRKQKLETNISKQLSTRDRFPVTRRGQPALRVSATIPLPAPVCGVGMCVTGGRRSITEVVSQEPGVVKLDYRTRQPRSTMLWSGSARLSCVLLLVTHSTTCCSPNSIRAFDINEWFRFHIINSKLLSQLYFNSTMIIVIVTVLFSRRQKIRRLVV